MASRTTLNISLPPELEAFGAARVATGRYQTASEVVWAGLRLLEREELERAAAQTEIRQKIAIGLEQARRGELLDGDAVFDELDQRDGE